MTPVWIVMNWLKGPGIVTIDPTLIPELLSGDYTSELLDGDTKPKLLATDNFTPELIARD